MQHFSKLYEKNMVLIQVPSNKNERLKVFVDEITDTEYDINFKVEVKNIDEFKYLTKNIIQFYIKSYFETCLKMFSLDRDVKVIFI